LCFIWTRYASSGSALRVTLSKTSPRAEEIGRIGRVLEAAAAGAV
jgi:hypothetical protein